MLVTKLRENTKAYIMLILATLFWAGNFTIGKFAYTENVPPYSLAFFRWILVWIILIPFTYKEISKIKTEVNNNLSLFFILGFTSVGIFSAFTYNALNYTQVINASLFNTAIPVSIILVCFLLKIEKTNIFQISGLIVSVLGILAIITRLDLNILLTLNFNKGDIYMVIAIISWGIYSALLKKKTFNISLLSLVHVVCTFGLIILFPAFLFELAYSESDHVSLNVGFYYMANAGGRLLGTLLSGLMYQWGGFVLCLSISVVFLLASWSLSLNLPNFTGQLDKS